MIFLYCLASFIGGLIFDRWYQKKFDRWCQYEIEKQVEKLKIQITVKNKTDNAIVTIENKGEICQ